jgi:hypothetical protein
MVAAAVVVVASVAWGATAGLLQVAGAAKDPAAAQVEAVKTGLSIAAGTGGVFALLLAVRRQWHQELTAAATTLDAEARRITELYTKAADQLGSDKAPVRLAGLHALERLAQDNVGQRVTIVQVLCAYLRMPYTPPEAGPGPDATPEQRQVYRDLVQERQVRLTAQQLLTNHLRPDPEPDHPGLTFWPDTSLDLTGATLIDFNLSHCHLLSARFDGAHFLGDAWFKQTSFAWLTTFDQAHFAGNARFDWANFASTTWFREVTFTQTAKFYATTFGHNTWLSRAAFAGHAVFSRASFAGDALFDNASFAGNAMFKESCFAGDAAFHPACFAGEVSFSMASTARPARSSWPAGWEPDPTPFVDEDHRRWHRIIQAPADTEDGEPLPSW